MIPARSRLLYTAILVVLLTVLASCAAEPDVEADPAEATEDAADPDTDEDAPEPTEVGGELRLAATRLAGEHLDPIQSQTDSMWYLHLMFDSLVGADYGMEEISNTGVAESWEVSDDGLVYTFTIREGIEFHNGDELTAEDVKFSLDRYHSEEANTSATGAVRSMLDSVTVLSPTEVEVRLTRPSVMFLTVISSIFDPGGLIVPKNYIEEVGVEEFAQAPIGSGPYRFVEREIGSHITVERAFDEHFAVGEVSYDRVTVRPIPEESTRLSLLRAGDIDFTDVTLDQVPALEEQGFRAFEHNLIGTLFVMFQIGEGPEGQLHRPDEPFHDETLREALSYTINREELNEVMLEGLGRASGNMWPAVAAVEQPQLPADPYDLDAARELLAQTPYGPDGEPLHVHIQAQPRDGFPDMLQIAEAVQGYFTDVGIESSIVWRDFADFRADWVAGQLEENSVILIVYSGSLDWQTTLTNAHTCSGILSALCDEEIDRLHAEWGEAETMEEYLSYAPQVEELLVGNRYVIPVVEAPVFLVGNENIPEGYQPGWSTRAPNVRAMVAEFD